MKPIQKQAGRDEISNDERQQLDQLRVHRRGHRKSLPPKPPSVAEHFEVHPPTRRQRLADGVAATIGSWRFIAFQSTAIALWITGNVLASDGA